MTHTLLIAHLIATIMMTGVIWFVQIVHYPLFSNVSAERFVAYERRHIRRTGYVVAPLMLIEATSAIAILVLAITTESTVSMPIAATGVALLALIWWSTFCIQTPCHRRLLQSTDSAVVDRLVRTNWLRTIAWTVRSGIAIVLIG